MNSKPTPILQAVQPSDPSSATLDPFDPANLRRDQSFTETAPVKKLLRTVPVRALHDLCGVPPSSNDFPTIEIATNARNTLSRPSSPTSAGRS
jgi:hypothetical protein